MVRLRGLRVFSRHLRAELLSIVESPRLPALRFRCLRRGLLHAAAALAESFAGRTRCSALAVSYNLAAALAGGTAPVIATALVDPRARHPMGPAFYLLALAAISLAAALTLRRTEGQSLRD
jgi:hypothetical protein